MSEPQQISAWSKRRAAVAAEADAVERANEEAVIAKSHEALAEKTDEEVLAELDLPTPEDMQSGDDFSVFMKTTVPGALRNRALRTLWRSDPVLANVDMLVDYGEDFTGKGDPIGVIKTIYRVGKGMLPDKEEVAEPLEAAAEPEIEEEIELVEEPAPELVVAIAPEQPAPLPPRRRMRFEFAEGDLPLATGTEAV